MTILNLMLGKKRGGLEQAALDYAESLACAGIPALTVISPEAWVAAPLVTAGMPHETLRNHSRLDFFAPKRLQKLAARAQATAIICHGNRALTLALRAFHHSPPTTHHAPKIIAVAHNYSNRRFAQADACIALTDHSAEHLRALGVTHIHHIPNMVRAAASHARPAFRTPPVIGSMGRFVAKKGFPTFIEALSVLRARNIPFRAILGGEGEDAQAIDALITRYQLQNHITRTGWVTDKTAFYNSIDLFVLPSLHEPFGIVLIEAMSHGLPVISTATEGPSEILREGDGWLVPKKDPEKLADAITEALYDPLRAVMRGQSAAALVARDYSKEAMAGRLQMALKPYI